MCSVGNPVHKPIRVFNKQLNIHDQDSIFVLEILSGCIGKLGFVQGIIPSRIGGSRSSNEYDDALSIRT